MTWIALSTIQTTENWLLTESVSGSLFRITHTASGTNLQSLRSVIAQAFDEDANNTYFDFRRLSFKPESEAILFLQPGGLLNRKLAIKRLDNLANSWAIKIEVLDGMPESISLPITQAEVTGLEEALASKEVAGVGIAAAANAISTHVTAVDPHSQYATDADVNAIATGLTTKEAAGTAASIIATHEAASDPHSQYATDIQIISLQSTIEAKETAGTAAQAIASHVAEADPHQQYATDVLFNQLQTTVNNKANSGANSSITSLTGLTTALSIPQGGTGSQTQNFVDLSTAQTIAGIKSFSVGQIALTNSTANLINFNIAGVAAPSLTTRSLGTKIVLYPQLFGSNTDYAIGLETQASWCSIPTNTATHSFKWYGGTTEVMKLNGVGNLTVVGSGIFASLRVAALNTPPATANTTGSVGSIAISGDAIYVCVAPNEWRRALLSTW